MSVARTVPSLLQSYTEEATADGFTKRIGEVFRPLFRPSIRVRIYGLLALGVLPLVAGITIQLVTDSMTATHAERSEHFQRLAESAHSLEKSILLLAVSAARFDAEPQAAEARFRDLSIGAIDTMNLSGAAAQSAHADGMALRLRQMTDSLMATSETFEQFVLASRAVGLGPDSGARGELVGPIMRVEQELALWPNVGSITGKLQTLKRYEQQFLIAPIEENLGRLRKSANDLDFALFAGPFDDDLKRGMSQDIVAYTKAMGIYVSAVSQRQDAWIRLQALFEDLRKDAALLMRDALDHAAAAQLASTDIRRTSFMVLTGGGLLIGLLVVSLSVMIAQSIIVPLRWTSDAMLKLAAGDDEAVVRGEERRDEVGHMARALGTLRSAVSEAFHLRQMVEVQPAKVMLCDPATLEVIYANRAAADLLCRVAGRQDCATGFRITEFFDGEEFAARLAGDPTDLPYKTKFHIGGVTVECSISATFDRQGRYKGPMLNFDDVSAYVELADDFEKDVRSVAHSVLEAATELATNAHTLASSVADAKQRSGAAASAAVNAQCSIELVEQSTQDLIQVVAGVSAEVDEAAGIAREAVDEVARTQTVVRGLESAVQRVAEATRLISKIAAQTNLLALNAAVEAARAGDAGRGFAVVADEVKGLARRTARVTQEIEKTLADVQEATGGAVGAIGSIGGTIVRMQQITSSVASAMEQQTASARQIDEMVDTASAESRSMDVNISHAVDAASVTNAAAERVSAAADRLTDQAKGLDNRVGGFLAAMRT